MVVWFLFFFTIWLVLRLVANYHLLWLNYPLPMLYAASFLRLGIWITILAGVLNYFGEPGLWNAWTGLFV